MVLAENEVKKEEKERIHHVQLNQEINGSTPLLKLGAIMSPS